jgi:hypothetical protein
VCPETAENALSGRETTTDNRLPCDFNAQPAPILLQAFKNVTSSEVP